MPFWAALATFRNQRCVVKTSWVGSHKHCLVLFPLAQWFPIVGWGMGEGYDGPTSPPRPTGGLLAMSRDVVSCHSSGVGAPGI